MEQKVPFRESRQDYDALKEAFASLDDIDPAFVGLTSFGKIVYANLSACDLLGYPKEELEGRPIGTIAPGMAAEAWSSFWSELDQDGPKSGRINLALSGKNELSVEFAAVFIHESDYKFCGVLMAKPEKHPPIAVDVSVQRLPLNQVLNAMDSPVLILDEQHKVTFLNPAACHALGATVAEASGKTVYDYLPKKYADMLWEREQDVLDSGRPSTCVGDGFLQVKYGESMTMLPLFDSSTSQKRILAVLNRNSTSYSDKTITTKSDETFPGTRNSADLAELPEIVERGSIGIFLKDIDNRYLWVNPTFAQMNGFESNELIGKRVDELIADPGIVASLHTEDDYVYATGQALFNRMIPRFNNQPGYYRLDKIPFVDRKGGIVGIIGLVVEVDEPQPPLNALKEELSLTSKKLMETETALRVLIERREQDVSLTREELNTKVKNLVVPYLELLKQTRLKPEQAEFVDLMETNLKNFYDPGYARLSSPTYKLSPTELKVAQFIRDGKTNKEIARLLHLSKSTILTHRHHIRVKLGIKNKKINLRSLLNS